MGHNHDFETIEKMNISKQARDNGIEGAEVRKCKGCDHEAIFLKANGKWIPMLDEGEQSEKDILLA